VKRQLIAAGASAVVALGLAGWSTPAPGGMAGSMGSLGSIGSLMSSASIFKQLGGMRKVRSLASAFVDSSLKDPRIAQLTSGKSVNPAATSDQVSKQLCAMLGGGCRAPLTNSQVASAASTVSPGQATAISQHFSASLKRIVANPMLRAAVIKALGSKLPGVLTGFL
jgi:hypothetical protein